MTSCESPSQIGPKAVSNWAYAPTTIQVHPLSRFADQDQLVVHMKLLDGDGFSCRGVGTLHVHVTSSGNQTIAEETVRLDDAETNRKHFDSVTRTYHIPIRVGNKEERVVVRVTFSGTGSIPLKSETRSIVRGNEK